MDLVQTVRKEGSRGGRTEFKWEDVKGDTQRENYLGHSLMAPVGRWQQGRDLNWYAKGDADAEGEKSAAEKLAEEKRKLKEAEEDAMLAAMGLPVPVRNKDGVGNANLTPLGKKAHDKDVEDKMEEKAKEGDDDKESRRRDRKDRSRRHRDDDDRKRRHHSRSRSRDRHRREKRRERSRSRDRRRDRSRSGGRRRRDERYDRPKERQPDDERVRDRSRDRDRHRRRRTRSRSPYGKHERRRD